MPKADLLIFFFFWLCGIDVYSQDICTVCWNTHSKCDPEGGERQKKCLRAIDRKAHFFLYKVK